jgi:SNF2 family DNA or RNA helicase
VGEAARGTVTLWGEWLEVSFAHDIRITHALRGLGARRMGMGLWHVPASQLPELARRIEDFGFAWEGEAGVEHVRQLDSERTWRLEDDRGLQAKAGRPVFGDWNPPVSLLPHQRPAVEFLAAKSGALLCDEQGLGKTLTCLTAFWLVRELGTADHLLVVCPNSLKHAWQKEIEKFFPTWKVSIASGQKRVRLRAYDARADVHIVNYEAARTDYAELRLLLRRSATVLACDESHHAKNAGSRTTRALAFMRSAAAKVWVMSGTPVPNALKDAYSQVFLADGGRIFGTFEAFDRRYTKATDQQRAAADLSRALEPVLLRRTKDEVLDLPPKVFEERYVELAGEQRRLYEAIRKNLFDKIAGMSAQEFESARSNVLTKLLRLSQAASNPRLIVPDFTGVPVKQREIDILLADLIEANGRKVVLWSYYVKTIEELLARYARYQPVAIYGAVDIAERSAAVERFQHDPAAALFIGNPQAAGVGLTLTAAHFAIYETLTWRYDLYAQSLDRIHRIGQSQSVTYFNILADGTIDEDVLERLNVKRDTAAEVLGDLDRVPLLARDEVLAILSRPPA